MYQRRFSAALLLASVICLAPVSRTASAQAKADASDRDKDEPIAASQLTHPVLWHEQTSISSLDLLHGQGGDKVPAAPFTFVEESHSGTNPKFDVRDASDRKWRVKLGDEARPEVVASRLLWAMGYAVNDDYVLPRAQVSGLKLKRGESLVKGDTVTDARFARKPKGEKRIGIWEWKKNNFTATRELNGLRVMMAVMNNWDLKDENNAVYSNAATGEQIFLVSDVGATFGGNRMGLSKAKSKGDVDTFAASKFIVKQTPTAVSFATPEPPTGILATSFGFSAKQYFYRRGLQWIGQDIPIADARWIGAQLGQLSHQQLVDAFRAGNFRDEESAEYVKAVESRIAELKQL